ncbi:MAG TPA: hypothetical protein DCR93_21950 [Cytophagales bacterium]|nr:hypothetical protein [Cytophagales bacterium]HAP62045.1 hypothetical protein [Cytophagales bacterium]
MVSLLGCNRPEGEATDIRIEFELLVNGEPLDLSEGQYTSEDGLTYRIDDFKVYLSNVVFNGSGSDFAETESYHLLAPTAGQSALSFVVPQVPRANYTGLTLGVGVDPEANVSLDNPGDLNPSNQMAWNWNVGYKFVLLEGEAVAADSTLPLVFHIGFERNYATQSFSFTNDLDLTLEETATLTFEIEVGELFRNPNTINFGEANNLQFGENVDLVAENWGSGFLTFTGFTIPE